MKGSYLDFLNDVEFYQWMAVCNKKKRTSNDLYREVASPYSRNQAKIGETRLARKHVLKYIGKNLTEEEFQNYVEITRGARRERELEKFNFDEQKELTKKSLIETPVHDGKEIEIVSTVKFEELVEEVKLPVIEEVKLPVVEEQIIEFDNETSRKFEIFKKMIGGNMKEGSR
jgi:hypothetical protein